MLASVVCSIMQKAKSSKVGSEIWVGAIKFTYQNLVELQCYEQLMSCYDLLMFVRRICSKCFDFNPVKKRQIQESLVEMTESRPTEKGQIIFHQVKDKRLIKQGAKQSVGTSEFEIKQELKSSVNQQEFHSIDSSFLYETDKNIRTTKKLESQLEKLQNSNKDLKKKTSTKTIRYASGEWEDTPIVEKINVKDEIQQAKDWFKKQYGKAKLASFRLNHAVRLRMQGQGMLNLLVSKLQDFKIKFMGESVSLQPKFSNKSKTLVFQHLREETGESSFKKAKVFKYFEIKSYAPTLQELIRCFVSRYAMQLLHDFKSIQPVEYQGGNLRIPFPILQVRQNGTKTKEEKVFHLASQMGESSQSNQQQRQIVFVSYSLDENEESWSCAIRIMFGIVSHIQIYTESFQDAQQTSQTYFKTKFILLQKYLQDLKIVCAY